MNLLKQVFTHEVFPALGCTEPIAVAYAASLAASQIKTPIQSLKLIVDPGVYKNGMAVTVPNTNGQKGNVIAGVLGALIKKPELKMEILQAATSDLIEAAQAIIADDHATLVFDPQKTDLFIEAEVHSQGHWSKAILAHGHTNLIYLEKDGQVLVDQKASNTAHQGHPYKTILKSTSLAELVNLAQNLDEEDAAFIHQGIAMNLAMAEAGQSLGKVGHFISDLVMKGFLVSDIIATCKIMTASASDARMTGLNRPVMSSGGSGNQGIVAILVPHLVGQAFNIPEQKILESIALSHLLNSYIKCYTGDISPLCGCAIAAGVGAAAAVVYQQAGKDIQKITLAVNNLISDLGGMLCDGAKSGCALKVVSSTDSAIRSAYMALSNHGITEKEGFIGRTAEETIANLSQISAIGMAAVDQTMLEIMARKNLC